MRKERLFVKIQEIVAEAGMQEIINVSKIENELDDIIVYRQKG